MKSFTLVITTIVVATALASTQSSAPPSKGMRGGFVFFNIDAEKPGTQANFNIAYEFIGLPPKTFSLKAGHACDLKFVQTPIKSRSEFGGTIFQVDCEKRVVTFVSEDGKTEEYPLPADTKTPSKSPIMFPIPTSVHLDKQRDREKVAGHWCDVYEANVADNYGKVWKLSDNPEVTMKAIVKIGSSIMVLQAIKFERDVEISDSEFALPSSAKKKP